MKGLIGVLLIILIILISGCTQTGELIDMGEENLTLEEELILEEFLNKTPEISDANETEQNASPVSAYTGYTEPQNITQPPGCPETCDDEDNCTYDYCSKDTDYECVHAVRICPSFVKICPDGVEVVCKNMCIDNSCTSCEPDCSEHQLPACELTQDDCGLCQILDTENCECAQITSCVNDDNCCLEGCNYTSDNDCAEPECNESWECGNWSECINGTQSRICTDLNSCGTEELKPNETQECEEPEGEGYVIINEVMYNPVHEYTGEFIELYNPSLTSVNLSDWKIVDNSSDIEILKGFAGGSTIIPSHGYAVITDEDTTINISTGAIHLTTGDNAIGNILGNSGETITLYYPNGTVADWIDYTHPPMPSCGNGYSLERVNNDWDCSIQIGGTPGSENSI